MSISHFILWFRFYKLAHRPCQGPQLGVGGGGGSLSAASLGTLFNLLSVQPFTVHPVSIYLDEHTVEKLWPIQPEEDPADAKIWVIQGQGAWRTLLWQFARYTIRQFSGRTVLQGGESVQGVWGLIEICEGGWGRLGKNYSVIIVRWRGSVSSFCSQFALGECFLQRSHCCSWENCAA